MGFLLGSKPKPADPVRMPVASDDANARAAAARKRMSIFSRQGRDSTNLDKRRQSAGTNAYGNSLLGQS